MSRSSTERLWTFVHAERTALVNDLDHLSAEQWRQKTLCDEWDVEHVVAHLSAAASLNRWQWMRSIVGARFLPALHNQRRLEEYLGATPAETLDRFRTVVGSRVAPTSDIPAYLGEVVVHAQDIRCALGLTRVPTIEAVTPVAQFFAHRDFTVPSRTLAAGLHLRATDGPFDVGDGPEVSGPTVSLVMAMAGRRPYVEELAGPGAAIMLDRVAANQP